MPSSTERQARFFAACAHGAGYDSCPPAKVSKDFNQADKGSSLLSRAMKGRKEGGSTDDDDQQQRPSFQLHIHLPSDPMPIFSMPDDFSPFGRANLQEFAPKLLQHAMPMPPESKQQPPPQQEEGVSLRGGMGRGEDERPSIRYGQKIPFQEGGRTEHILPGSPLGPPSGPQDEAYGGENDVFQFARPRARIDPGIYAHGKGSPIPEDRGWRPPHSNIDEIIPTTTPEREAFGGGIGIGGPSGLAHIGPPSGMPRIGGHESHMSQPRGGLGFKSFGGHGMGPPHPSVGAGLGGMHFEEGGDVERIPEGRGPVVYDDSLPQGWMPGNVRRQWDQRENANEVYNPEPAAPSPPVFHRMSAERDRMAAGGDRTHLADGGLALGPALSLERQDIRQTMFGEQQAEKGLGTAATAPSKGSAQAMIPATPLAVYPSKMPDLGDDTGPWGTRIEKGIREHTIPRPPSPPKGAIQQEHAGGVVHDVNFTHGGVIGGAGAGRTDRLPLAVGVESHVIPADVVSALGQGTSDHGGNILWEALGGRDHEIGGGSPIVEHGEHTKEGGRPKTTSILAASGEFVVRPDQVLALGERGVEQGLCKNGEEPVMCGHRLLDEMIARVRKYQINWLRTAPPPKKSTGGAIVAYGAIAA
jgi:hypothetical protein